MQNIPSWLMKTIAGLLAVLMLVVVINQLTSISNSSKNQNPNKQTITISAQGKVTATPDLATIMASVSSDGSTAAQAQAASDKKYNDAVSYLKGFGIEDKDIATSGYNIYPKYDYKNGSSTQNGYTAAETLTIKVHDTSKVGQVLTGLTQNGINQIQNVSISFDNPDTYKEQAREQALGNAKDKAQKLAAAAGVSLGKLITFSETSSNFPMPMYQSVPLGMGMGGGVAEKAPDIQTGSQEITAEISVTYEIK